jgi:hypothetical protein
VARVWNIFQRVYPNVARYTPVPPDSRAAVSVCRWVSGCPMTSLMAAAIAMITNRP